MKFFFRKLFVLNFLFKKRVRSIFFSIIFGSFGNKSEVIGRITCYCPQNIFFGDKSYLNEGVILNAREKIKIGNGVHISSGSIINTGYLDLNDKTKTTHLSKEVVIEDNVWLASGVVVNPGVTIGKGSIIGAGSVVTRDIAPNSLAYGVPAISKKFL